MRLKLKGIHSATKKLADGTRKTYHYAWKGGPPLNGNPGSAEFIASYNEAVANRSKPQEGTVFTLISEYRSSAEYKKIRPSTKRDYDRYLKLIEEKWGKYPLRFAEKPAFRGDLKIWRDSMSDTPRKADLAWAVLARIFSVAKDRGRIAENPCVRGGRIYKADRVDCIWTDADVEKVSAAVAPELRNAMMLALWTGQRQGDLLTLPWSAIDGDFIRLKQSKGGRRVSVRIIRPMRELLDAIPKHGSTILTNSRKQPWTSSGFRASWGKQIGKAGVKDLTFHDLRGSAITRLAEAGCSEIEISSITGHSSATVSSMLDRHYLSRTDAISESAGKKLEDAHERKKLQTAQQTGKKSADFAALPDAESAVKSA